MKSATCYSAGDASHSTDRNGGCCWRGGATKSRLSQAMPAKTIQSGGGQVLSHCSPLPPTGKLNLCSHSTLPQLPPYNIYFILAALFRELPEGSLGRDHTSGVKPIDLTVMA